MGVVEALVNFGHQISLTRGSGSRIVEALVTLGQTETRLISNLWPLHNKIHTHNKNDFIASGLQQLHEGMNAYLFARSAEKIFSSIFGHFTLKYIHTTKMILSFLVCSSYMNE